MDVSPRTLRKEAAAIFSQSTEMLEEIEHDDGLTPLKRAELKASLLQSKALALNTLTLLNEIGK